MTTSHVEDVLDPVKLVQSPRPICYIPNPSAQLAFSIIKTYDHSKQALFTSLAIVDMTAKNPSNHRTILKNMVYSEAVWLDNQTILYLRPPGVKEDVPDLDPTLNSQEAKKQLEKRLEDLPDEQGKTIELWAIQIGESDNLPYRVGCLPAPIENLYFQQISSGGVLAFSAQVYPPYTSEAFTNVHKLQTSFSKAAEGSTGQTYDSVYVRHWDEWLDQHGKQPRLFVIDLDQKENNFWTILESQEPRSLFPSLSVPVGPFGSVSDFDLSPSSVIVTAKDPDINPAWHTRQNIYITSLYPSTQRDHIPLQLTTGDQGATSNPVFSPAAKDPYGSNQGKVAWLEMHRDGYESDQNQVVVYDLVSRSRSYLAQSWDRSPSKIIWGRDDQELYLLAEEHGRIKVFYLDIHSTSDPICLTHENSVSSLAYLRNHHFEGEDPKSRLLLTISSLSFSSTAFMLTLDLSNLPQPSKLISIISSDFDLDQGEDFWFEGAESKLVHGILVRPPAFVAQKNQRWPLMFLIHGGPQGAWEKAWSLRWNPNTLASAGYIVAMINPTGSTGYGQEFTDAINQNWGGRPYKDLVAGYQFLLKTYPEIDGSRTAALGASYGGYMVNWLMGHNQSPLNFKAFVTHDGIFNTLQGYYATDELYFPEHDHGGTPVQKREEYEKWNPMNFVGNWKTPCLVIHSRKDYRLCESEGLSVFNALQRQGIASRFLYFPDENHWITNPPNSIRWYHEIFRFLGKWCPPGAHHG